MIRSSRFRSKTTPASRGAERPHRSASVCAYSTSSTMDLARPSDRGDAWLSIPEPDPLTLSTFPGPGAQESRSALASSASISAAHCPTNEVETVIPKPSADPLRSDRGVRSRPCVPPYPCLCPRSLGAAPRRTSPGGTRRTEVGRRGLELRLVDLRPTSRIDG